MNAGQLYGNRAAFALDCSGAALGGTHFKRQASECCSRSIYISRLAAAGFQEMRPAFALVFASMGDAITGINRADTASVTQ